MRLLFLNPARARVSKAWATTWLRNVVKELKRHHGIEIKAQELVLVLVSIDEMQRLNRTYRGLDKPTDILSFSAAEPGVLGELVVCMDVIKENAKQSGLSGPRELGYMLIHGVLHLLGFDHQRPRAEKKMMALQDAVFAALIKR